MSIQVSTAGAEKVTAEMIAGISEWDAAAVYDPVNNRLVTYQVDGVKKFFESLTAGNTGNLPTDVLHWVEVSPDELEVTHVHPNLETLNKITPARVEKWDNALAPADQPEHEAAATGGATATHEKAATPRGLYWFWEQLRSLAQTFKETITFLKAPIIDAFKGVGERIVVVDNLGRLLNTYTTADEFTAVPPTYLSNGKPGQKAWDAPYLYYCVAENFWIRFLSESSTHSFEDLFVQVPAALNSAGKQGQFAYDQANNLVYFCVGVNAWIRFSSIPETFLQMYVAIPPTSTSPGQQGQRAYDPVNSLMYECPDNNIWVRWPVTNNF